jgi:hypothetical protein
MLCFMGVCNDLLSRIGYPCMISGWIACFWLECDMDRLLHLKWAIFWYNYSNLKICVVTCLYFHILLVAMLWLCYDPYMCSLSHFQPLTLNLAYLRSSCRCLYALFCISAFSPWFIHCQQGGEEVSLMKIQKRWANIWKFASTCSGGACICSGGAFLLFSV